jgi:hypothetical protein
MKKVFICSQYKLFDPPTANTIRSLSNDNIVLYFELGNTNYDFDDLNLKHENIRLVFVKSFFRDSKIGRFINFIKFTWYYNVLIIKFKPDYLINFLWHPIAALFVPFNGKKIAAILDIVPVESAGFFDKFILSRAKRKLTNYDCTWFSDELKRSIFLKEVSLTNALVVRNCPEMRFTEGFSKCFCNKILRYKFEGIDLDNAFIITRAGAFGKNGGIEETITSLNWLPENVLFFLLGNPSQDYLKTIEALIIKKKLENRVFIFVGVNNFMWKCILGLTDLGHAIHFKPTVDVERLIYEQNSELSLNRIYQYASFNLPILCIKSDRLHEWFKLNFFYFLNEDSFSVDLINSVEKVMNSRNESRGILSKNYFDHEFNWENQFEKILRYIDNERS